MQVQCKRSISKIYFLAKIQNKSLTKNSHLRTTATSWPWGTWCWPTTWRTWRRPPTRSTTRGSGSTSWERWWDPAAARPTRWTTTTIIWICLKYFIKIFRAKPLAISMTSTRDQSETLRGRNWKLDGRIPSWPTSSTRASIPYLVARGRKFETSSLISTLNRFLFIVLLYHL